MAVVTITPVLWGLRFFSCTNFTSYDVEWVLQVVLLSLLPVLHIRTRNHWEGKFLAPIFPWLPLWGEKKVQFPSLAFQLASLVINSLSTDISSKVTHIRCTVSWQGIFSISHRCFIRPTWCYLHAVVTVSLFFLSSPSAAAQPCTPGDLGPFPCLWSLIRNYRMGIWD